MLAVALTCRSVQFRSRTRSVGALVLHGTAPPILLAVTGRFEVKARSSATLSFESKVSGRAGPVAAA